MLLIGVVDSYSTKFCVVIGVTGVTMIAYISISKEITNLLGSILKALLGEKSKTSSGTPYETDAVLAATRLTAVTGEWILTRRSRKYDRG